MSQYRTHITLLLMVVSMACVSMASDIVQSTGDTFTRTSDASGSRGSGDLTYSLEATWRKSHQKPIVRMLKKHRPRTILIHHTGTKQSNKAISKKLQGLYDYSIRAEGKKAAWGDVPYHFYIDNKGNMMGGRPVEFQPDTNTEFDPNGYLNITVEGNYTRAGGDVFSSVQKATLKRLVADLKAKYKIKSVMTHKDVAQTECPGHITAAGL